jgi:hypothetical protein
LPGNDNGALPAREGLHFLCAPGHFSCGVAVLQSNKQ